MCIASMAGGRYWRLLRPAIERTGMRRYFRADAAFAQPEVYEYLEEHGFLHAMASRFPSG